MGDLAHAHVSEFSGNGITALIGSNGVDQNAVNFRYKMRVICKGKIAIFVCLGALTPAPYALCQQLIANRPAVSV